MRPINFEERIELIPEIPIRKLHGFLKGINTDFEREEDRWQPPGVRYFPEPEVPE